MYSLHSSTEVRALENFMKLQGREGASVLLKHGARQYKPIFSAISGMAFAIGMTGLLTGIFIYNSPGGAGMVLVEAGLLTTGVSLPFCLAFGIRSGIGHRKIKQSIDLYNEGNAK